MTYQEATGNKPERPFESCRSCGYPIGNDHCCTKCGKWESKFSGGSEAQIRKFTTGATRDADLDKLDYEGFLSPLVLQRFGEYMHKNRQMADGSQRASDNWQKGIPLEAYMKSAFRHFVDWWQAHRGIEPREDIDSALCGLMFNAMGYLHERLKSRGYMNSGGKAPEAL